MENRRRFQGEAYESLSESLSVTDEDLGNLTTLLHYAIRKGALKSEDRIRLLKALKKSEAESDSDAESRRARTQGVKMPGAEPNWFGGAVDTPLTKRLEASTRDFLLDVRNRLAVNK
jgi:hypothetical protein